MFLREQMMCFFHEMAEAFCREYYSSDNHFGV